MMVETIETVIIGAGHAGLSASYCLKQRGREHVVLEKASKPGDAWRSQRWDSFTFVSPNWTFQLPGGEYDGQDPDGFMGRDELVGRLEHYAEQYQLPIEFNTSVTVVQPMNNHGFLVQAGGKDYHARNVIAANGWFQLGIMPPYADKIPLSILQLHTSSYRNPQALPPGAILVVGSGQSGGQIAEELNQSGRKVFLATGIAPHAPRHYRGKDIFYWLVNSGFADQSYEQLQFFGHSFVAPMISGKNGGHSLNLHKFIADGIVLLGHALDYADGKLVIAPDLKQNLQKADFAQQFIVKRFDNYIQQAGIDAPSEELPTLTDAYQAAEITALDFQAEGISTIIWACGYKYGSSMFKMPILNTNGIPDAPFGDSVIYPGLYFVGFPFLPVLKSGFVVGIAKCSAYIAERIASGEAAKPVNLLSHALK